MTERDSIDGLLESYAAAVQARDVDAFLGLYDEGARIFDTWERWSYDGLGEWTSSVAAWLGSHGADRLGVSFDDVRIVVGDDVAAVDAYVTYRGLSPDGEELRAMQNRLTWTLRRRDGAWKIVHEHTSAPADYETKKVTLQR